MKRLLFLLLSLVPLFSMGQYVKVSTHYNAKNTANQIIKGELRSFLNDEVDFTVEKRSGKFKSKYDVSSDDVVRKVYKCFDKGNVEYVSRTNGGYTFTIAVVNKKDNTVILNYCTFSVDAFTQKIKDVEISKGL